MKLLGTIIFSLFTLTAAFSQTNLTNHRKGDLYVYWGWNRGWYSDSDITFKGDNYNFELQDVIAKDRQSPVNLNTYFNPIYATIPQYNFRIGYFINEKHSVSIGVDHMKYVVQNDQIDEITGEIHETNTTYDGVYDHEDIKVVTDFLTFEHTDGLNYINIGFRRFDELWTYRKFKINLTEGVETGMLVPRTNTTLLNNERYDRFHLSGFGISSAFAVNFEFNERFFIQTEIKGGYINMPDIRTTKSKSDKASQSFFFKQLNVVFGVYIKTKNQRQPIEE